ncbi:MAG: ABC transporter ATP-binding protein [Magnetovibrio sp.]|nr:ABC transporter ATP-binding protein [Magnetovibrio sp.]
MSEPVLSISGLTRAFGGLVAVDNVSYELPGGDLRAIIGPNGAGKTTLFNLISGMLDADRGTIKFRGQDISAKPPHAISQMGIARTLQIKSVFEGLSVYDNLWISAHARTQRLSPFRAASSYLDTSRIVEEALEEIGISRFRDEKAGNLSYGDIALLEIAIALCMKPNLLLLDEPVAGMSPEETETVVTKIKQLSKQLDIVLIEHDMSVVFGIADVVTVMNNGAILCEGPPDEITRDERVQEAYLGVPEDGES